MQYHQTNRPTILDKFAEPAVIDNDLLTALIIEQSAAGETKKLYQQDGIELDKVEEIRIEFHNILNMDHLWVLKNLVTLKLANNVIERIQNLDELVLLKELDLSFNRIEIIENLNHLFKLEILLLNNNIISVVEGMDNLNELRILNLSNNNISDWEHVIYLRKFQKLRSLNTSGNPCLEKSGYLDYLFAFIPQLLYHQYKMIPEENRQIASEEYCRTLSNLQETENKILMETGTAKEQQEILIVQKEAFIEFLDRDFLFEKMFINDKEGTGLYMVNEETQNAFTQYKINFCSICNELYEAGLTQYNDRMKEIEVFCDSVKKGKDIVLSQGRAIVDEIVNRKRDIIKEARAVFKKIDGNTENTIVENFVNNIHQTTDDFDELISQAYTKLMSDETTLHDLMQDIIEVFGLNMKNKIETFIENIQGYVSQLRSCETEYADTILGLVLNYISDFKDESKIPTHLLDICGDKEILKNNFATSHDRHLEVIDAKEISMITGLNGWYDNYMQELTINEARRNHQQILEISHFINTQQELLNLLQTLPEMSFDIFDTDLVLALQM